MKKSVLLCALILLLSIIGSAQSPVLNWLNSNIHPLSPDTSSSLNDLTFLKEELKDKRIIGLGEASHGTHEFYSQKKRLIAYLVEQLQYKHIGIEMTQVLVGPINQYLQKGKGNLKTLMKGMALYNTEEIYQMLSFIRDYNQGKTSADKVVLFGFDREEFWGQPLQRDSLMAEQVRNATTSAARKTILWSHNVHIAKDTTMAQYPGMGKHLNTIYGTKYYALGFDTFKGSVNVIEDNEFVKYDFLAEKGSFSDLFAQAKYERFLISFRQPKNPFNDLRNTISNIYSAWHSPWALPIRPGKDFDGIVFLRTTTASTRLAAP